MLGVLFWTLAAASGGRRLPNVALLAVGSLFFFENVSKTIDYLTINFFDKTNVLKVKVF